MVTGTKPFTGREALENAVQRLTEEPISPRRHASDLDPRWESAILGCLRRNPAERPKRASEVVAALAGQELPAPPAKVTRRIWAGLTAAIAALLALSLFIWRYSGSPGGGAGRSPKQHVAVLPLKVLGGEADLRVFADGLMETMTIRLSQYERGEDGPLLVVPASEVRQQRPASAGDAARKLGVSTVVEGSVEARGDRLRLLLALVDARDNRQAASIAIEEQRSNAWALQDAAAARIARALNVRAAAPPTDESAAPTAAAPGAYEFYVVARGYLQRSDKLDSVESAITVARRALDLDPKYAAAYAALAEAYWHKYQLTRDQQWIEQALEHCRTSLTLDAGLAEAHTTMGRIHLGTGRHDEARQDYERALSADPRSHEAYQGLADAYFQQKLFDQAEATYLKAISMRPGDWAGYRRLGAYYFRRGEFAKAAEQFQKVVDLTPDNAQGYVNLGTVYFRQERIADAERVWLASLKLDPGRYTTLSNLAKLYYETGRYKKSIDLFERALQVNGRDYLSWGNLGIAYRHEGQTAKSAAALEEAIKLVDSELLVNPKRADLYSFAAYYRALAGKKDVEDLLARALALGSDDNDILIRVAGAYALIGKEDRAAEFVRKAMDRGYPKASLLGNMPLRRVTARIGIQK
jgi:tetratricopeptide (TPR) repeat protein